MDQKYEIKNIPIDKITVVNSRDRNEKSYNSVKGNILRVGLKKPITVRPSQKEGMYELVCGEGRLNSFIDANQIKVPAIIRYDLSRQDAFIMSLVENMARRRHSIMDLMQGIKLLKEKDYNATEISRKIGIADSYVCEILKLLDLGEERLIAAVEKREIPVSIAVKIASSPGNEQKALQQAYESGDLRGNKFLIAQRLIENRNVSGKTIRSSDKSRKKTDGPSLSARQMVQKFQTEIDRMKLVVEKAETTNSALSIIIESLFHLIKDENFTTLLRAEGLDTMPQDLDELINERGVNYG